LPCGFCLITVARDRDSDSERLFYFGRVSFFTVARDSRRLLYFGRVILWSPYVVGRPYIFSCCDFYLSFFPGLISATGDWMSTWCGLSANLECMSEMCGTRLAANTGRKKSSFWHHRTTLSGCIFATKARIHNRKKTCLAAIPPPHVLVIWRTSAY